MTINEALDQARRWQACRIVWNSDTGELIEVVEASHGRVGYPEVQGLRDGVPVRWREFESARVTLGLLKAEARALRWAARRAQIADSYVDEPTEKLVEILETRDYPWPMDESCGDRRIVEELVLHRRSEITGSVAERLHVLTRGGLIPSAAERLSRYLAVVGHDVEAIIVDWNCKPWESGSGIEFLDLLDCLGAARVSDEGVVQDLIDLIGAPVCYKTSVMIALGRIGAPAGAKATAAIRANIPEDHSPDVRERVLERLSTSDERWVPCPECRTGWVHDGERGRRSGVICPECRGLMVVSAAELLE